MKKLIALLLALAMVACLFVGCNNETNDDNTQGNDTSDNANNNDVSEDNANTDVDLSAYKIAMVTDYGDITDQSFNQTTYEACKLFADTHGVQFQYYKPTTNDTAGRVASIELAIAEGYNVLVLPGYAFGGSIVEIAPQYPDVKFIALDVAAGDFLETAVANAGETYDYNPDNWDFEKYVDLGNVYSAIYQEELSGYMAGYATVKLGYTEIGYLGGMAVPAVIRFGHGYVQGVNDAAADLGVTVNLKYVYGGQFFGDADITAVMDTWFADGTEIVFACGGGIYTSACEAAQKVGGKVIGVDVDQSGIIDGAYGEGMTVTSAMKGLAPTVIDTLTDVIINGNWANYVGKIETLGLVSGEDPTLNYVQIPMETTQWNSTFTQDDYKALVADLYSGVIEVSNDISALPAVTNVNLDDQGAIK